MGKKRQAERFLKVSALGIKVGGSFLRQKAKAFWSEPSDADRGKNFEMNARRIAEVLGQMKGTIMKFGQMLSLNSELFPKEFTSILASLQGEAPSVSFVEIQKQIEKSLKKPLIEIFSEFNETPLASASIGQAHVARLKSNGKKVVVKVQYPGVDEDVDGDIENIKLLLKTLKSFSKSLDMTHMISELKLHMVEELNYLTEAKHLEDFRAMFAGVEGILIPQHYPEVSSRHVLVMDYLPGIPLQKFMDQEKSGTVRNRVADLLMRFYFKQLFEHGILHADPNAANFAINDDHQLLIFDFGCIKTFPKSFITAYKKLLNNHLDGKSENLHSEFLALGFKVNDDKVYPPSFYLPYGEILMEPFMSEPYSFAQGHLQERLLDLGKSQMRDLLNFKPPKHILMHDRVMVGVYNHLRAMEAAGYWRSILLEYIRSTPIKKNDGKPPNDNEEKKQS